MTAIVVRQQATLGQFARLLDGHIAQVLVDRVLLLLVRYVRLVDRQRILLLDVSERELLQVLVQIFIVVGVVRRVCVVWEELRFSFVMFGLMVKYMK